MKNCLFLLFCSICWVSLYGQQNYIMHADSLPTVSITGTSTLHAWTVKAGTVTDYPQDLMATIAEGESIDSFAFAVEVMSLDGGRGASMNSKIQNALQATTSPAIHFQQTQVSTIQKEGDQLKLAATGLLTIAGQEKEITVDVSITEGDGRLVFTGSKDLKMSEFQMTPPSAMFGQIQTNDDITVHFEFVYLLNK